MRYSKISMDSVYWSSLPSVALELASSSPAGPSLTLPASDNHLLRHGSAQAGGRGAACRRVCLGRLAGDGAQAGWRRAARSGGAPTRRYHSVHGRDSGQFLGWASLPRMEAMAPRRSTTSPTRPQIRRPSSRQIPRSRPPPCPRSALPAIPFSLPFRLTARMNRGHVGPPSRWRIAHRRPHPRNTGRPGERLGNEPLPVPRCRRTVAGADSLTSTKF